MSAGDSSLPEDFDAFWKDAVNEAIQSPLEISRSFRNEFDLTGFQIESLSFASVDGGRLHGWIALPDGVRNAPGFLWIPPYGRASLLPNSYGTRAGFVSLSFNFFGLTAFHQEAYHPTRGYFSEGALDPRTWVMRSMFQNALRAMKALQAQPEVDHTRLGAMGMSQGGGIAIWLAAHSLLCRAVCADMPFLGGMATRLTNQVYRYPLKELIDLMESEPMGKERMLHTLSYFDTVHQATRCKVPTQVSLGLRDPASKPDSVRAIYDALAGEKRLVEYSGGHDWDSAMVEANQRWLSTHLD